MRMAWLIGIAAILTASPAAADITARYVSPINNAVAMTVQVNDKGDSRVSMGNQIAFLTIGGDTYLLLSDLSGVYAVRQEDWIAFHAEIMREALPADFAQESGLPTYAVTEGSTETIGGRVGKVWWLRAKGQPAPAAGATRSGFDFVVSADSDLAPIGRALAKQMAASSLMMTGVIGSMGNFSAGLTEIFAKGTVIRMSRVFRLDGVDTHAVPASEFMLPPTVLTREQFAARNGRRPR